MEEKERIRKIYLKIEEKLKKPRGRFAQLVTCIVTVCKRGESGAEYICKSS